MRIYFFALGCFLFLNSYHCYSQTNFYRELLAADPVKTIDTTSKNEKIAIHQAYFKKAVESRNRQQQFYGHLYLSSDYLGKTDYNGATLELFIADSMAQQSGNPVWLAAVRGRRGILDFELNDAQSALKNNKLALDYCRRTKDSACLAINLKELALAYQRLKKYDSARHYFDLAIPMIRKHTDSNILYAYYSNYSNLLNDMRDYAGAKQYLDSAMVVVISGTNLLEQSSLKNNLAAFYINRGEYDTAIKILEQLIFINKQHKWHDQLSYNYTNLSEAFSKTGNYRAAYEYLINANSINNTLKSAELQIKMINLNADYEAQKKEMVLNQAIERRTWLIVFGIIAISLGIWRWFAQMNAVRKNRLQSQKDLTELTRILLEKNTALSALEEKLLKPQEEAANGLSVPAEAAPEKQDETSSSTGKDDFEKNLYNQRILTEADWTSFKAYFEKAYPGYLMKLRNTHLHITEAEERMFLFIKLNLTNKESAAMVGISTDSIRKTRTRLRKKLEIAEDLDLDAYVKRF